MTPILPYYATATTGYGAAVRLPTRTLSYEHENFRDPHEPDANYEYVYGERGRKTALARLLVAPFGGRWSIKSGANHKLGACVLEIRNGTVPFKADRGLVGQIFMSDDLPEFIELWAEYNELEAKRDGKKATRARLNRIQRNLNRNIYWPAMAEADRLIDVYEKGAPKPAP